MSEQGAPIPTGLWDEESICFISDELRAIVMRILSDKPSHERTAAKIELHQRALREDPYLIASSVYDFLWKRVPADKRKSLYPLVGDFFLTALEKKLGQIGPNNMSSRYRELLECYTGSGDVKRMLEGPLYCADLFLLKVSQLVLDARGEPTEPPQDGHQSNMDADFLVDQKLTLQEQIAHSLEIAKDALTDAQHTLSKAVKHHVDLHDDYVSFIRATLNRLTLSWQGWKEIHSSKDIESIPVEDYFRKGINLAEKINSLVLAAMLLEQAGEEYQDMMCKEFLHHRFSSKSADHPRRGCTFDAGEIYRDQGLLEREHGAYVMSERRFTRAIGLFGLLHDRTSVAQTLVERARLYLLQKSQAWRARADLYLAAQNIASVQLRVPPQAALPVLPAEQVVHFYEQKGLLREAEVCKSPESDA